MDIPQKIDEILEERKKLLPQISAAMERVEKARKAVEQLDAYRSTQADLPPELAEKLATISTRPFYEKQKAAVRGLEHLEKRFSRDEINISFVGRAGQGKSLVLQRISGLEGDIIPSADGSDCTGARSIISNHPNTETKAEITFYSEAEFVGIVNRYLGEIFGSSIQKVQSLSGICSLNMQELQSKIDYSHVNETALLDHLKKYVEHGMELREKLGTQITISKGEIESYVAQYNSKNPKVQYFTYLGVKEARILSAFPCKQCGKIVLVDTIGTGATALGVEDDMLRTVREDSDAIILMFRPDSLRGRIAQEDYDLVRKISEAVFPEYAKEMLFWLINRVESGKGTNTMHVPRIMDTLKKQDLPVAQYLNVNCWEQNEVENRLLIPVLEQMSSNLFRIDNMILERMNEQLQELEQIYRTISIRVERAMGACINKDERKVFERRIDATIASATKKLRDLYRKKDKEKTLPCILLKDAASQKLRNIRTSVPTKDKIMQQLNDGRLTKFNALELLTDRLRLKIINDFLELNSSLHEIVLDMKRDVVCVLADDGQLRLFVGADTSDPNRWLKAFREKLDEAEFPMLRNALKPLEDFNLSMENFLIYKVRCRLAPLDWSLQIQPPQLYNSENDEDALADEISTELKDLLERVYQGIDEELTDFYVFPNTALFAVLRDFHDRVVNTETTDGGKVDTEWRYLYEDNIPMIWPEEHKSYLAEAGQAEEWNILAKDIHTCAADGYFRIDREKESK